ncbi:ATP-binding cassette domain-containing protein [Limosilactobacillus caecicola]|uniref:ATP-binding cassette domain-containing protein n=1 Tax=Limosilactobacillus caecicola TaxID=2941332 RepID=UPI00203B6224|nr:ABC transporter ATP-binding protein [Limosilactobacillus caecicola]
MNEQIQIDSLQFSYQDQPPILQIPHLTIPLHHLTLLHGPSGSGKSTFLKILAGLLPKYGGSLSGRITFPTNVKPALMFQDPSMQFALDTPRHEIEFALENLRVPRHKIPNRTAAALTDVGITKLADRQFTTLSGGEQQRATLAVIVAMQKEIILLDEPFASLDHHNRDLILQQLVKLQQRGKTIIIADHDLSAYTQLDPNVISFREDVRTLTPSEREQLFQQFRSLSQPTTSLPDPTAAAAITLQDFTLSRQNSCLIQQEQLNIIKSHITLLTGESGSGKSTLFQAFINLVPHQGNIQVNQRPLRKYSRRQLGQTIGLVFQNANDQFMNVTVNDELNLSLTHGHHPYFTQQRLATVLKQLGLSELKERVVYSLSGGQRKKLQILLMLMMGQPILLMDEPFSGLDSRSIRAVIDLIRNCQVVQPQTIIIISHQLAGLADLIDYHLVLDHQHLRYQGGATR